MMQKKEYSLSVGDKTLVAEFNNLAERTNGSVLVRMGDTAVLATAVISKYPKDNFDFFPLTVDFEEKFYAVGKILGSRYSRREGRPTDEAILSGRLVDRTIRPLFEQHIRHEVQITILVLSLGEDDPDILAVLATSLALSTSDIPWNGPVSAVRVGKNKDDKDFIINPTYEERNNPEFESEILACGKDGTINMIEATAKESKEEDLASAFLKALEEIEKIQEFQKQIIKEIGKEKMVAPKKTRPAEIEKIWKEEIADTLTKNIFGEDGVSPPAGNNKIQEVEDRWIEIFSEKIPETDVNFAKEYFEEEINNLIHEESIKNERRPDGRGLGELRDIYCKAGELSKTLHGSGIFYRGGTHVLSVLTLGGPGDSQMIDGMEIQTQKRFMHHYNFPPFSTGETGRMGGLNRRMIGHGTLAEKSLLPVLPDKEKFPYTIRVVSECLSSNGSTSMGSACATTLALMDGGVPIKAPVAGIAIGLMMSLDYDRDKKYKVLTDIQGPEDHYGDMDFKVAGTKNGVTAIQMDVKVSGIPTHILSEALERGKVARMQILEKIEEEIAAPREKISPNAPQIIMIKIRPDQIGSVIGTGGKIINKIKETTGAEIDIEDDGSVFITGIGNSAEQASEIIKEITKEYKVGEKYLGEVIKIAEFGAFVKIGTNADGLLHISEIAPVRVEKVEDFLSLGQKIPVIIKEIDERDRIKLSLKEIEPDFFKSKITNNQNGRGTTK